MEAQQLLSTTAPWVAATAGLLTAVTALRGAFGARRLRSDVMATSDLLKALPESGAVKARESLEDLLAHQAERMRDRGRDGVQFTPRQAIIITVGFTLVLVVVLIGAVAAISSSEEARQEVWLDQWIRLAINVLGTAAALLGSILVLIVLGGAEAWMDARTKAIHGQEMTSGDRVALILMMPIIGPMRLVRWARRRRKANRPPATNST